MRSENLQEASALLEERKSALAVLDALRDTDPPFRSISINHLGVLVEGESYTDTEFLDDSLRVGLRDVVGPALEATLARLDRRLRELGVEL